MKLFAQHGFNKGQKLKQGFERGLLDGVIFSPKDIALDDLTTCLDEIAEKWPQADRLFDPQLYASLLANTPGARCGTLLRDYGTYFGPRRRSQLEQETRVVADLEAAIRFQASLNVTGIIAPNIIIPRSLDSIEAAISKDFLRNVRGVTSKVKSDLACFATLALSHEALRKHDELVEFLSDITVMDEPPDGFYILVASNGAGDARYDVFHPDSVAGWMLVNHALTLNGFRVINGYSDVMTPFLGAAGAEAGATGWWSNLRSFSLDRFGPENGGGRLPIPRYLSCALLNRITFYELENLRRLVPAVLNKLETDALYDSDEHGSEPERNQEVLQTWDAIKKLNKRIAKASAEDALPVANRAVDAADDTYDVIEANAIRLDQKSDRSHLEPLREGLAKFAQLAELGSAEE